MNFEVKKARALGDPTPSRADIQMTQAIVEVARPLGNFRARPHRRQGRSQSFKAEKLI